MVWTPDSDGRKNSSERASGFYFDGGSFLASGYYYVYDCGGCSRGVRR